MFFRTAGENLGRDGCRVPIPWSGTAWLPGPDRVVAFSRATFACVVNLSDGPVAMPVAGPVPLTSGPLDGGLLPPGW